jgi:hypothetical protein
LLSKYWYILMIAHILSLLVAAAICLVAEAVEASLSLEADICSLKSNMIARGSPNADKIFSVADEAEPESYLTTRWYRDCKSCYMEPQKNRIHFNIANKGTDLSSKGLSNYTNRDDIKMLHHMMGYNPNGKKLITSTSNEDHSATRVYTGSLSLLSLQKHHRKQEKVVIWGGHVDHEQMSKSSVSSSKITFDKARFWKASPQIEHLRGPISHAAILYQQLVLYETSTEVVSTHIEDVLARNEHGVTYGDKLLLTPLISGAYSAAATDGDTGSRSAGDKKNICVIPDVRDVVGAQEITQPLARRLQSDNANENNNGNGNHNGNNGNGNNGNGNNGNGNNGNGNTGGGQTDTGNSDSGATGGGLQRFVPNTYMDVLVPPLESQWRDGRSDSGEEPRHVSVFVMPPMATRQMMLAIRECEYVVSSSVQGAILADGLNVPNHWLYNPATLRSSTSTWEYNDYALGVGRECNCHVNSIAEGIRRYFYSKTEVPVAAAPERYLRSGSFVKEKPFALAPAKLSTIYSQMLGEFPYEQICPVDTYKLYLAPVLPQTLSTLNFDGEAVRMLPQMTALPLSVAEQKALLAAIDVRSDMELFMANADPATQRLPMIRRVNHYFESRAQKPLLCAVFLKAEQGAMDIFFDNVKASHGHCDWAVVAYGGSHSILDRIKAEFHLHANQHTDRGDGEHTGTHNHDYASLYPHYKVPKLVYCNFADEAVDIDGHQGAGDPNPAAAVNPPSNLRRRLLAEGSEGDQEMGGKAFRKKIKQMEAQEAALRQQAPAKSRSRSRAGAAAVPGGEGQEQDEGETRGAGRRKGMKGKGMKGKGMKGKGGVGGMVSGISRKDSLDAQLAEAGGFSDPDAAGDGSGDRKKRRGRRQRAREEEVDGDENQEGGAEGGSEGDGGLEARRLRRRRRAEQPEDGAGEETPGRKLLSSAGSADEAGDEESDLVGDHHRRLKGLKGARKGLKRGAAAAGEGSHPAEHEDSAAETNGLAAGTGGGRRRKGHRDRAAEGGDSVETADEDHGYEAAVAPGGKGHRGGRKGRGGASVAAGEPRTGRRLLKEEEEEEEGGAAVHTHIPKQAMFTYLTGVAQEYGKIWLLDEDISLVGFNIPQFLYFSNCHDRSTPTAPQTQLLVTQPIIAQNTQDRISVSAGYWKKLQNESLAKQARGAAEQVLMGVYTGFVESQAPLFESNYFVWYTKHIIEPLRKHHLSLQSGWGAGHTVSARIVGIMFCAVLVNVMLMRPFCAEL